MVIAGIDEAGYGPVLGPLVVGCAALRVPAGADDLWTLLARAVSKTRDASGRRLHVNDSKKVYSPALGLGQLEKSVLCLANASNTGAVASLDELSARCAASSAEAFNTLDWYRPADAERFPLSHEPAAISIATNALKLELTRTGSSVAHLHAYVVLETELNRLFDTTRNKAATSFGFVARHLQTLLDTYSDGPLTIYCDRQGGRTQYGSLLRQMFEAWALEVIDESPARSGYRLTHGSRSADLIFTERAEEQCMSVAIASMLSKYLREALMRRFNAYWQTHQPDIKPTAGYWTDGLRFMNDLAPTLTKLGIDRSQLIRAR